MPVLLTGIALILATVILETKSHHFIKEDECPEGQPHIKKHAGKEGNEFMQVEYFREDHMADLWWVDMDKENSPACNLTDLFNSGKKENVTLVYGFLFFEHYITNLSISEEGGIQSVDSRHDWFIAPLLVDPSRIKKSTVKYVESSNALVVQWEIESDEWDRELSFQLVVFRSVRIQFAYKRIPFGSLQNFSQKFDGIKNTFGIGYEYKLKDKKLWIGSIMDIKECDELLEGSAIEFKQLLPSYEMCCSARDLDFTHPRPKEELEKTDPTTEAEENTDRIFHLDAEIDEMRGSLRNQTANNLTGVELILQRNTAAAIKEEMEDVYWPAYNWYTIFILAISFFITFVLIACSFRKLLMTIPGVSQEDDEAIEIVVGEHIN
ncbi:Hypothetical predicted protein [Cloeon dipterum]|uniref:Uncharacterized protein n=1 Tax=Cloeon dipterum TaxID=197152 RepID=A0A8S1DY66_9INSE|nr:Hypothetical predicted protein [Cloeon dipterum]